jgi:hypothetical protein
MSAISVRVGCIVILIAALGISSCSDSSGPTETPPPPSSYSVSAVVAGLNGTGLVLQNTGSGDLGVTANGTVTFAAKLPAGASYAVTVSTQPIHPAQTCTVSNGAGTVAAADVSLAVDCVDNYQPVFTPAAKGDPQGTAITQSIDATGGNVTSADGRISLDIPAGALSTATTIGIQPISSTVPNGVGISYRLQPEGTTFSAPITLTFHLSATETMSVDSSFIVTQHADGLWYSQKDQLRDDGAQTVSIQTAHFSDWGLAQVLLLKPAEQRVRVTQNVEFTPEILLLAENVELANPVPVELALPVPTVLDDQINSVKVWSVNGVVGGNNIVGFVNDPGTFTAPNLLPTPAQVTESLTVNIRGAKVIAVALADIFNEETWSGISDITQIDGTTFHSLVTFVQVKDSTTTSSNLKFQVQSGQVTATIPSTSVTGCPQSITPTSHAIGPNDGRMQIVYDLASGPNSGTVTGGGETVWPVTFTVACPNGTQTLPVSEAAPWWPMDTPQTYTENDGVLDIDIKNIATSGHLQLVRQ